MTEKIKIEGKDVWIVIEPHAELLSSGDTHEYFTASYHSVEPVTNSGGVILLGEDKAPLTFSSPVEALEFANEKLLGIV